MTLRRIPIVPTLIVLAAVAVMLRLGFWQLDRLHQKAAMLARYERAQTSAAPLPWPRDPAAVEAALFHHADITCTPIGGDAPVAGRNRHDEGGWAHVIPCRMADGAVVPLVLGWSSDPAPRNWGGGTIGGTIAPAGKNGARLLADPPLAGLAASARPDPGDIPNNHLAYAVQWFLFAGTALVIYALALRKRLAANGAGG